MFQKLVAALERGLSELNPRLQAITVAASALPRGSTQARARLFSLAGFAIGDGTQLHGTPRISGSGGRLVLGRDCSIEESCAFELERDITIGDRVCMGPGAMILTRAHELPGESATRTLKTGSVQVGDGALLGARSIILPGVTIGAGAIVNPGAVVNRDVPPHTCVGGVPAVQTEVLSG